MKIIGRIIKEGWIAAFRVLGFCIILHLSLMIPVVVSGVLAGIYRPNDPYGIFQEISIGSACMMIVIALFIAPFVFFFAGRITGICRKK